MIILTLKEKKMSIFQPEALLSLQKKNAQ